MVQCSHFCFGGGGYGKFWYTCAGVKIPVSTNGLSVIGHPPHEKNPAHMAVGFCLQKIWGVWMDVKDHVWRVGVVFCIRMPREVVWQQFDAPTHCLFHCFYLFDRNRTKGHQNHHIDCLGIIQNASDDLLDPFYSLYIKSWWFVGGEGGLCLHAIFFGSGEYGQVCNFLAITCLHSCNFFLI